MIGLLRTGFIILLVLGGISCSSVPVKANNELIEVGAPTFTVGDNWEFKAPFGKYNMAVVDVAGNENTITIGYEPKAKFIRDKNLAIQTVEGELTKDARIFIGWKFLDFPMHPGKKFSYRVEGTVATFSIDVEAVRWENIKVPAGKFRTLRIETCWRNESSGWYDCGMTYWYSPEAKNIIKRQTPIGWAQILRYTDFELNSFSVK